MRRVAVIAYHSSPLLEPGRGDAGGMTVYLREVARVLAKHGVRTDVFTRSASIEPEVVDVFPHVRIVSIPAGPARVLGKLELVRFIGAFAEGVRGFAVGESLEYDLVHSHYWQSGIAARALALRWDVPMVHSNHTLGKVKNRSLPPGDAEEPEVRIDGEMQVIHAADTLIASTDDELEQLACLYGASHDRLKTIYPGVDHSTFGPGSKAAARTELGIDKDEAVLAYVGRIQPLKGLDLAIQATEQLVSALERPVRLLIIGGDSDSGGGSEVARLRDMARSLGIEHAIRFEGAQPHDRTPLYYRAADAVVVCSYSESFGLSALEAQACGTPVVATDVGGLRHVVRDGASGYLVGSRDPSVFAARLKTLLSDHELHAGFTKAAVDSASNFTWEKTAAALGELYECLITLREPEACTC